MRWHQAGTNRDDAEELSRQLERDLSSRPTLPAGRGTTLGRFLVEHNHDLRHTHASFTTTLQDGVPIKVVSERLGHSHPAFTMATYQHVLPGMQADAAARFAKLLELPAAIEQNAASESTGTR